MKSHIYRDPPCVRVRVCWAHSQISFSLHQIQYIFSNPCNLELREYTVQFGRCLVDLFDNLVATPCGMPSLPSSGVPPATVSFQALPESGFDLGYAQLGQVYNYVRRGKNLVIPAEWRDLIPNPPWWTETAFNLPWDRFRVSGCLSIMGIPKRSWRGKGFIEAHNHETVWGMSHWMPISTQWPLVSIQNGKTIGPPT